MTMRRVYHIGMDVSLQPPIRRLLKGRGPRARTARLLLDTALRLTEDGVAPSVSAVAEAAGVSRATAYRYFPSQADLVHAVVEEALGPILDWKSDETDAVARVHDLVATSLPRIESFEATFRAALKLSLDQWAAGRSPEAATPADPGFTRGHRVGLLMDAIAPAADRLGPERAERLAKALSFLFGIESLIVIKDIWGDDGAEALAVAGWAADALVRAAMAEDGEPAGNLV